MTARRFFTLDVFTETALAGNPLAVVLDAEGLQDGRMQAIAREFNLSETVFVLPPETAAQKARIRIFTPDYEMPFAGHPTIGTAVLLALQGGQASEDFVLGENVGPIPCRTQRRDARSGSAEFDVAELPRRIGAIGPPDALAAALQVPVEAIGFPGASPGYVSAGAAFAIVPLRDAASVDRAVASLQDWPDAFGMNARQSVFLLAPGAEAGSYYARMFASGVVLYEDPATGSASAASVALMAEAEQPADGEHRRTIIQGVKMGRPSRIDVRYSVKSGALTRATIGGSAVILSEGRLFA
jgi:trans-2,3-dihydro-3-hydroxyanthranilate isomerase